MTKTFSITAGTFAAFGLFFVGMLFLVLAPQSAAAAVSPNAFLGGGNALSRATSGQSQGLTHASSTSDLLARLTFASTRGGPGTTSSQSSDGYGAGKPEETPPANSNPTPNSASSNPEGELAAHGAGGAGNNGGASSGNGGNGGNAGPGGLVRSGSVVSNATAVNVLNVNIVRIGR